MESQSDLLGRTLVLTTNKENKHMKTLRTLLLVLCTFAFFTGEASAQIEKGNFLTGGSGSFALDLDGDTPAVFALGLSPQVGYFVTDEIVVGALINGFLNVTEVNDDSEVDSDLFVGPFLRYYLGNAFVHAEVGINNGIQVSPAFGIAWFVTENVAVEPIAKLNIGDRLGVTGLIGFQLYFNREELNSVVGQ